MASEFLTGVLVVVTAYYAWQNRAMVREMRNARSAQLTPKLLPSLRPVPGAHCLRNLSNVGPGPALGVDLTIGFGPGGPSRQWRTAVVAPMEGHDFYVTEDGVDLMEGDQLTSRYSELWARGSCRTALGDTVEVDEVIDTREIWELMASQLQPPEDPISRRLGQAERHATTFAVHCLHP